MLILIRDFVLIRDSLTKQNTENQYVSSFPFSAVGRQRDTALGGEQTGNLNCYTDIHSHVISAGQRK